MQVDGEAFTPFFGQPSEAQMAKIRELQPVGSEPLEASDLLVVSLVICDSFMRRDGLCALAPNALAAMSRTLPGTTITRDHDERDSSKKNARIFDSRITITDDISPEAIAADGYTEANLAIFEQHGGYIQVWGDIYLRANSPLAEGLRAGEDAEVSYHGSHLDSRWVCSECACSNPDGIYGENCHMLESGFPWEWFLTEEELESVRISAYDTIEAEGFDSWETSWVTIPAYSRSGIQKQKEKRDGY